MTEIEEYVIDKVREMRHRHNMSQRELADMVDLSAGFIANVESHKSRAKYNLNHIHAFAKAFGCSPRDFLPESCFDDKE
jgi:transcriptional regulator with XRE-family HTH domain